MFEYMVLSIADEVDVDVLGGGTKEEMEEQFLNDLTAGDFQGNLLMVKVVKSAEIRYDVQDWPDEEGDEPSKSTAVSTDVLSEYSRTCAAQEQGC